MFSHSLSAYIAWKYLRFHKKDSTISFMIRLCFLGIFIGTCALMLTLIITNGFEKVVYEKMHGVNADFIISAPQQKLDGNALRTFLLAQFPDDIAGVTGNSTKQVILYHRKQQHVLALRGIDPDQESTVSHIHQKIMPPSRTLDELRHKNTILLGHKVAKEFHLEADQEVLLLVPEPSSKKKILLDKQKVQIAGLFNVGLDEYDAHVALCSLETLNTLFDENGVGSLVVKLKSPRTSFFRRLLPWHDPYFAFKEKLQTALPNLIIYSWRDLYPALVSSLILEKYVAFIVLALITLVASLNMISMLAIHIQHKRRDIAIFKAMGMSATDIQKIFLYIGMLVTICASLLGLGVSALVGYILQQYPIIQLPDVYYVSHLPARMEPELFVAVFVTTVLLGFLATWLPAYRTKHLHISDVLRSE